MSESVCQKCREVVNRARDGSVTKVRRCAHGVTKRYNSDVTPLQCNACTLRQPLTQVGLSCREHPPSDPVWAEPHYGPGGGIAYPPRNGVPAPPIPEGYRRKEEESTYSWWFESEWPECPYRQMMNKLTPQGDLKINSYCGSQGNREVTYQQCQQCLAEVERLGGSLDEEDVLENLPVPEEMRGIGEEGVPDFPRAAELVANYWKAVKRWVAAGRPTRSKKDVKGIHADFCAKCNWYDEESSRCKGCGCSVKPKGIAMLNKIEMATEHCPQRFW